MTQPRKTKSKSKQQFIPIEGEEFRKVPGFPSLEASNLGRVRNRKTGTILTIADGEYPRVSFQHRGKAVTREVHRLVALAFFGPIRTGMDVAHKNDEKSDCRLENLKVITHQQNCLEALRAGRLRSKLTPEQIPIIRRLSAHGVPAKAIAAAFGVKRNTITNVITNRAWSAIPSAQ